jgi:hypothetical protein
VQTCACLAPAVCFYVCLLIHLGGNIKRFIFFAGKLQNLLLGHTCIEHKQVYTRATYHLC